MTQAHALNIMQSGASVFLTGAPGAGKTYVLNEFIRRARKRRRRVAVTASTGIAATHVGGSTVHLWSGLGTRKTLTTKAKERLYANETLRRRYVQTDVLVIDEVSMLHGARLSLVNEACQLLRDSGAPFGGLQVILVGDMFQLPPVTYKDEPLDFVHASAAWADLHVAVCYITEQHRQRNDRLLDLLQAMRAGVFRRCHIDAVLERLGQLPPVDAPVIRLCTHNRDADAENHRQLAALGGEPRRYHAAKVGPKFKLAQLTQGVLAPATLELKVGAEVMFVVNNPAGTYVNGTRGRITGFRGNLPIVRLSTGRVVTVEPFSWVLVEDGRERAEVVQLPLRLGWAITIHKSQGMSLDAAVIDLRKSFTPGMGYVALSRVRSLEGIYLTGINKMALRLHPEIAALDQQLREASARLEAVAIPERRRFPQFLSPWRS
jgi:ATP-dependent DNA helicase PIF1